MSTRLEQGEKLRGADKTARIPIKVISVPKEDRIPKPKWIRAKIPSGKRFDEITDLLRKNKLHSVCEEAACPNIGECFNQGTATFMIMGDICTRRCPFCDVAHGRPNALDTEEPKRLAEAVKLLGLDYVVITSVDRDDLRDGGAGHFADCIREIRAISPKTKIEILVPDFRGRMDIAIDILSETPPDVLNHNMETVPRLYKQVRPGADYMHSLMLLKKFKARNPDVPTKSGLMVGVGETDEEMMEVMKIMREHDIEMITVGQYLQPSGGHLAVERYVTPQTFKEYEEAAYEMGFKLAHIGPMVRSSYHAGDKTLV